MSYLENVVIVTNSVPTVTRLHIGPVLNCSTSQHSRKNRLRKIKLIYNLSKSEQEVKPTRPDYRFSCVHFFLHCGIFIYISNVRFWCSSFSVLLDLYWPLCFVLPYVLIIIVLRDHCTSSSSTFCFLLLCFSALINPAVALGGNSSRIHPFTPVTLARDGC